MTTDRPPKAIPPPQLRDAEAFAFVNPRQSFENYYFLYLRGSHHLSVPFTQHNVFPRERHPKDWVDDAVGPDGHFLSVPKKAGRERLRFLNRGSNSKTAKLNDAQVLEIRRRLQTGLPADKPAKLAAEYGLSRISIYNIKTRKTWGHI